jgi:hypothetical protein
VEEECRVADIDPNLVRTIAEQVLAAIRGASAGGGGGAGMAPVQVHPPIGQCTGDYSKFPELKGMVGAPGPRAEAAVGGGSSGRLDGTSALPPAAGGPVQPSRSELYPTGGTPARIDGTSTLPPAGVGAVAPDRHLHMTAGTGPNLGGIDGTTALPPAGGAAQPAHGPVTATTGVPGAARALDGTSTLPPAFTPPAVTALKGVITASHLRSIRGPVRLAKGAILTPLAQDFIRERGINIMTDEGAAAVAINGGAAPGTGGAATMAGGGGAPILWWIDGQCPSVAKLVEALRPGLLASRERGSGENLKGVVKELAALVKAKKVAGGLLFVPSAARAICYANRCQSLRAVVATNDRAVSEGIELLGANVLVVEYPPFGFKAMLALVKPFVESVQAVPAAVQRELDELRNCG